MTTARQDIREVASQCVNGQCPDSGHDRHCQVPGMNVCERQWKDATFDAITNSERDTDGKYSNSSAYKIAESSKYESPGSSSNSKTIGAKKFGVFGSSRPFVAKVAGSKPGKSFVFDSDAGTSSNRKASSSHNLNSNLFTQKGTTSVPISATWGAPIETHSNGIKAVHGTAASTRVEQDTCRSDTGDANERLLASCPLCTEKFSDR